MGLRDWLSGRRKAPAPEDNVRSIAPRADAGIYVHTIDDLEEFIRRGGMDAGRMSLTGERVNWHTSMRVAAVYGCVSLISGGVANMPLHIKRNLPDGTREDAANSHYWNLFRKKPCSFMRARPFRRMATAHVLLRGNFYALKVKGLNGKVLELIPLHPDRVTVEQLSDLSIVYKYSRPTDGKILTFTQAEILHLYSLTLDGVIGVTPITYARETIGGALSMQRHVAQVYKNGARVSGILTTEKRLGPDGRENIRASLEEYRSNGEKEGKELVLEDGLTYERLSLTPQDLQYLESRKMDATDICTIFRVPPHMIAMTDKSTSWGSGIYEQTQGFVTWTLEDYLTMWEDAITDDVMADASLYAIHNRNALVRGNLEQRGQSYALALQWGWMSPDEVRQLEDMNPRADGEGDQYYPPPNMTEPAEEPSSSEGDDDEPNR